MLFNRDLSGFDEHQRIRLILSFGFSYELDEDVFDSFLTDLHKSLTIPSGGLRYTFGTGIWRDDGNSEPPFTGDVNDELGVDVALTLDPKDHLGFGTVRTLISHIQERCRLAHDNHPKIGIQWVNMEVDVIHVSHFDITA